MTDLILWLAPALLVFWSVGAYNRLVRLRGEVRSAFGQIDAELQRHLDLATTLPADAEEGSTWGQLLAANRQVQLCLATARAKPLDGSAIAALVAAGEVLTLAWDRAEREDAHDLAGPLLPPSVPIARAQLMTQVQAAAAQFNEAVARYNRAVSQFPAVLLAWIFGFRPAHAL